MSDRGAGGTPSDNPFGDQPPDNPFGRPLPENPFGSPPPSDPFGRGAGREDPFAAAPAGDPVAPPPANEAWRQPSTAPRDPWAPSPQATGSRNAEGAIAALVLGIVGLFFCPLCSPFAWHYGRRAERLVDASGGVLSGRGEATAGKILGIVACGLWALGVIAIIALIAVGSTWDISTSSSDGSSSDGGSSEFHATPPPLIRPRPATPH